MAGKFIGIGVGPGDPELITIKAAKTLKTVDVICVPKAHADKPSMALGIIKDILDERKSPPEMLKLVFPMTKDESGLKKFWTKNASVIADKVKKGSTLAFITIGDPMFYSTFIYLCQSMKEEYPEIELEIIPGVTSLTACAASSKIALAENEEVVTIIPSNLDPKLIEETAKHADTIILMKCAHRLKDVAPILKRAGFAKKSIIALVVRCTMPEEKVIVGKLGDIQEWDIEPDYFSMAIIKRS